MSVKYVVSNSALNYKLLNLWLFPNSCCAVAEEKSRVGGTTNHPIGVIAMPW